MTNAALRGKPNKGNPHVLFDYGAGAPRRGRPAIRYNGTFTGTVYFAVAAMLFASLTSWADNATYYVSAKDGNDSADGLSPTASLKTLASFVGDAGAAKLQNATVVLSPGVYAVEETLTLKNGVLRSAEGTSPEEVVLDGGNTCQVVYADKGELSGLTICNGVSDETSKGATGGGGIYATGSIISNCIVRNCNASYAGSSSQVGGGGIHVEWGRVLDSVVSNCSFTVDNAGVYGAGGGVCTFYTAIVKGNMIADCRSVSKAAKRCGGGGLAMFGDLLSCVTEDNTIEGCSVVNTAGDPAGYGGGVFIDDAINGHLEDFMIRGCRAGNGGGGVPADEGVQRHRVDNLKQHGFRERRRRLRHGPRRGLRRLRSFHELPDCGECFSDPVSGQQRKMDR